MHQRGRGIWGKKKPFHSQEIACADVPDLASNEKNIQLSWNFR